MGLFNKDIGTLDDLFVHQLRDIYYAEKQIVQTLPEMIEKATDSSLKRGFETHLGETKNHVKRLEQVFKMHGVEAKGIDCPAIDGIIEEADDIIADVEDKKVLDAALIAAAQAVEHYERWHIDRVGETARPARLRQCLAAEPRRGKSDRCQVDLARRTQRECESRIGARLQKSPGR